MNITLENNRITLSPMTEPEFQAYRVKVIQEYAREKILAGNWSQDEALERSRDQVESLLPQGIQTPNNYLFSLKNENGEKVGLLWYASPPKQPGLAFIYDFEIYPPFRRRGFASQAIAALEQEAKSRGLKRIELHVFGHNTAARALYNKMGFVEANVMMTKNIS
jgi:ribosomal protein S18 acetylase RimI-like enzyme